MQKNKHMKTLIVILAATFLSARAVLAHEHSEGAGLFGLPPEYLHVLLNPLPVYGLAMGILALAGALLARSRAALVIALMLVILASASAWPVLHFGQSAYARVRGQADEPGQQWLDEHMTRAEKFVYAFYVTALLGIGALVSQKKFPKAATPLAVATLLAGVASLGVGGWMSKAGGQIRHPEFRHGPPAAEHVEPEHHHENTKP